MSTFQELQNEVLAHGFDSTSYTSRVSTWINQAQARIARRLEIPTLYTTSGINTVAGTATIAKPADTIRVTGLTDAADGLRLMPVSDLDRLLAANQTGTTIVRGMPQYFAEQGANLLLSPVPDRVYALTLSYYKRPTDLSANGDVSIIPADYHDLMVSWTLSRAYRSEDDMAMSQFYMTEFIRDLGYAAADMQETINDSPRQVPGTWAP